jgi:hypothetical protein
LIALPDLVTRIANNKEHEPTPKAANMKAQPSTPTSKLSEGLQNMNNTNNLYRVILRGVSRVLSCLKLYLPHVPFLALFFMA